MASNNNNNALWKNIREIKKKAKIYYDWVDLLACEIWKCKADKDGNDQPILNEDGELPESRIEKLEESLGYSDSDTGSVDSLDKDIEQLKEDIRRLDAQTLNYATGVITDLGEVEEMGRDNQQRLNVIGGEIDDLEMRANAMEADRDALEARIVAIEEQRSGTGGTGGGKRRRKRKTRKKRRKKKTKKRGKKKRRKKKTKRR